MAAKKPVIGLLGAIASGKSTVAKHFGRLGCAVIEADRLAHNMLEKKDLKDCISSYFGAAVLTPSGQIDRRSLGRVVFSDPAALKWLEALIHPPVMAEVERLIDAYQADKRVQAIVLDMPLLAEAGRLDLCDVIVFVEADLAVRRERLRKSGKFDENELKKRENFQISLDKKKNLAHYILCNNSDESDMAGQVAQLFSIITGSR